MTTQDRAREAAAKALNTARLTKAEELRMEVPCFWLDPFESLNRDCKELQRVSANAAIDAFLSKVLEGADEKLAEIAARIKRAELHENESICFKTNEASELLTLVTALSAKLKEVEGLFKFEDDDVARIKPNDPALKDGIVVKRDHFDGMIKRAHALQSKLTAIEAEKAALSQKVRELTTLLDAQLGTPCEQIRHQQEIEELKADRDALSAKLKEQKAAHAKMLRDEANTWADYIGEPMRRLADKIEGGE